jgi:plasmid stabilization system protein ParE
MEFRVTLTPKAERDLQLIGRYIAQTDVRTSYRFCDELVFAAETLQTFPDRHGSFVKRPNIRKLPYRAYLIFYKIDEAAKTVEILRFWHSARDQGRLRLKEEAAPAYSVSPSAVPAIAG